MKKVLTFVLSLVLCLGALALVGCKDKGGEVLDSYNNITDFSNRQGWRNWYYLYGDVEAPEYMVFDLDNGRWNGRDWYSFMEIRQFHPGNNGETILGFKAPKKGTLDVSGTITRCPTDFNAQNADGVFVYAVYNTTENDYLYSETLAKDAKDPYAVAFTQEVKAGEMLYFVLNANGNNSFDNTRFDITVKYV